MAHIVRPDARYHRSYLEAADELAAAGEANANHFVPGDGAWVLPADAGFDGLTFTRESLEDPAEFRRFVRARRADELEETARPTGWVPCTFLWFIDGDRYLGSIALRHRLTDSLRADGGHIGYTVRPSARGEGHATEALRQTLELAGEMGLDRVLLTTDRDNEASMAVIRRCGGVQVMETNGSADVPAMTVAGKYSFWIDVPAPEPEEM
ncbi:GNAT family N-acetyltransferase [Kribbia dieselivorans]|uniref:GNAT family N-acetyltransferase n=1 Tax=Kribbia dieselivorans TaxID=331526 RepID=UPI00083864A1|nr:GNAT family N-acetyltransferase [Kribbia dieselivorans]